MTIYLNEIKADANTYVATGFEELPIVLDNGTYMLKAGYSRNVPQLVLHNYISRGISKETNNRIVSVGTSLKNALKTTTKTMFDADIIVNAETFEYTVDYVLQMLKVEHLDGGIVLSESLAAPKMFRKEIYEIMFECYNTSKFGLAIDSLESLRYNRKSIRPCRNTTVVSMSNSNIHVIPIIDGTVCKNLVGKIYYGAEHAAEYLLENFKVKYYDGTHKIGLKDTRFLLRHLMVADNYAKDTHMFLNKAFFGEHNIEIQSERKVIDYEKLERKKKRKEETMIRIKDTMINKRQKKQEQLKEMREEIERRLGGEEHTEEYAEWSLEELQEYIDHCDKNKKKKNIVIDYELLARPDSELTQEECVAKKKMNIVRYTQEYHKKRKEQKEIEKQKNEEEQKRVQHKIETDIEGYIADLRKTREQLMHSIKHINRMKRKHTKSWNKRVHSSHFSEEEKEELQVLQKKLKDVENQLLRYDKTFVLEHTNPYDILRRGFSCYYDKSVINFNIERMKVAEVIFNPDIIRLRCAGLVDILHRIIQHTPIDQIFITGGFSGIQNIENRIFQEVTPLNPIEKHLTVTAAEDRIFDAFRGMGSFDRWIDRNRYGEEGADSLSSIHPETTYSL